MGEREREEGRRYRVSDAEEVAEVLGAVSEALPKLIRDTIRSVISEETGRNLGKAVGAFYKELVSSGIAPEDALDMAKKYLTSLMESGESLLKAIKGPLKVQVRAGEEGEAEEEAEEEAED